MPIIDDVLASFQNNTVTSLAIFLTGFLICHLIHAVRYAFFGYGTIMQKIVNFFKLLLFLEVR